MLENLSHNYKLSIKLTFDPIKNIQFITPPKKVLAGGKVEFEYVLDKNNKR